ncbi:hypothetical protein FRB90_003423 [Tulasnella sp. 427]|nr:hypothetical protein FRB90_003423 [Tulasnella sp. 427]
MPMHHPKKRREAKSAELRSSPYHAPGQSTRNESDDGLLLNPKGSNGSVGNQQEPDPLIFEPSERLSEKLDKLGKWRINRDVLDLLQRDREFHGGSASVSLAQLITYQNEGREAESSTQQDSENACKPRQYVAVKKLKLADDTNIERLLAVREIEVLSELSHPNVIKLTGFVDEISNNIVWLVFPWEENGNVRDYLTGMNLEIPERISLIDDVAQGLEYLHCHDPAVCHGDLKSLNILVNAQYRAVITDFGSARFLEQGFSKATTKPAAQRVNAASHSPRAEFSLFTKQLTVTGCLYTTRWAAPELLNDENSGLWSDIWAFGWICFEIMTNDFPFQGFHDMEVIVKVVQGNVPSITDDARMSSIVELCKLVTRCWSTSPLERPTATECHMAISWMPMIVPSGSPSETSDAGAPRIRSPALLLEMARVHEQQGDYSISSSLYSDALKIYQDLRDDRGQADAICGLASLERLQLNYKAAEESYNEALEIYVLLNDDAGRADASWGLGEVHRLRNHHNSAESRYRAALKTYEATGNETGQAQALWGLAETFRSTGPGLRDNAIKAYTRCLEIYTRLGSENGRADALWGLAELHLAQGRGGMAISTYSQALAIYQGIGNRRSEADVLWQLAESHRRNKDDDNAEPYYSQVILAYDEIGNQKAKSAAMQSLAALYKRQHRYEEAVDMYDEALEVCVNLRLGSGKLDILNELKLIPALLDHDISGVNTLERLALVFKKVDDTRGHLDTLWKLGNMRFKRNELEDASFYYFTILEKYKTAGNDIGRAEALLSIAKAHVRLKEFEEAESRLSEAASLYVSSGDQEGKAKAILGLADLCHHQTKAKDAIAACSEAFALSTDIGDDRGRLGALLCSLEIYASLNDETRRIETSWKVGHLYRWLKELSKATELFSEVLTTALSLGNDTFKAYALRSLGVMHRIRGNYDEALSRYAEAMEIYAKQNDDVGRAKVLWGRAEVYCHKEDYQKGSEHYKDALEMWPALMDHQKRDELMWGIAPSLKSVGDWPDDPQFDS